jgi:pimeloyl-ACP methyl ester carboxylesterase
MVTRRAGACNGARLRAVCADLRQENAVAQYEVNGIRLEAESFGDESRPVVLLVMGLGMQLLAWPEALCRRIADAGYRVLRFDNRDIGLSSKLDEARISIPRAALRYALHLPIPAPYKVQDMACDALGLLDALGIARAHVVGVSMGGMIAQNFAASWPQRCLSLTSIMSSSGNRRLPLAHPRVLRLLIARPPQRSSPERQLQHFMRLFRALSGPGYTMPDEELRERLQRSLARNYSPAGTARQLLAIVASGDRSALLRSIAVPTLVLHGSDDPLLPIAHGRDCARKIPGARFEAIEGMGHDLPTSLLPRLGDHLLAQLRSVG